MSLFTSSTEDILAKESLIGLLLLALQLMDIKRIYKKVFIEFDEQQFYSTFVLEDKKDGSPFS